MRRQARRTRSNGGPARPRKVARVVESAEKPDGGVPP